MVRLDDCIQLVELGLPIIPLCSHNHANMSEKHLERCKNPGKLPLIKDWQEKTSTTPADIKSWLSQFKTMNIGMPTGQASGYVGIDIDNEYGEIALQKMSGGNIPETWEFQTASGRRLLYQLPPGTKTKKYKDANREGGHEECAILCDGQQTVLPPSIHMTGAVYAWVEGKSPWELDCAETPKWLLDLVIVKDTPVKYVDPYFETLLPTLEEEFIACDFILALPPDSIVGDIKTQEKKGKKGKTGHHIVVTPEMLNSPIPEGQRDNTMTAIVGHYLSQPTLRALGKETLIELCQKHNLKYCDPPLEEEVIIAKVEHFWAKELEKSEQYEKEKAPPFEPSKLAVIVRNQISQNGLAIHYDQHSKTYYYTSRTKGPWKMSRDVTLIDKWIRKIITQPGIGSPTWDKKSYINEVRHALEELFTEAFKVGDDFDLGNNVDALSNYIVVNQGLVDWRTGDLYSWDPKVMTTVSYDVDYDPTKSCPKFEQLMVDWLPDPYVRAAVQEFIGYCLVPNTRFRKALFLYGKGQNGKSMLLEFLQDFWGDNKSTMSYDSLFARFGPANLAGKMVNIYDDTSVSFTRDTGILKNLIAGGTVAAEFKGKDHFTFTNVARFIFSAQETPKTTDHTDAWYNRWIFVKFPNKFKPSNQKKLEIQAIFREERSGIFNWMLEGLRRLITQDGFTESTSLLMHAKDYRNSNDTISMFVSNMCVCAPHEKTTLNKLYAVYKVWAEIDGLRPLSKRTFGERLEDLGFTKEKGYYNNTSGVNFMVGLKINDECDDYVSNSLEYNLELQTILN